MIKFDSMVNTTRFNYTLMDKPPIQGVGTTINQELSFAVNGTEKNVVIANSDIGDITVVTNNSKRVTFRVTGQTSLEHSVYYMVIPQ